MAEKLIRSMQYPGTVFQDRAAGIYLESFAYKPGFFRFNWHHTMELLVVLCGEVTTYVEGRKFTMTEDDVLLINSHDGHATLADRQDTALLLLHLSPTVFAPLFPPEETPRFAVCSSTQQDRDGPALCTLRRLMAELYHQLWQENLQGACMGAKGALFSLCALLLQEFPWESTCGKGLGDEGEKARRILEYVDENYTQRLYLEDVARYMGMNRTYLSTFFKKHVGLNFYDYLTRKRLSQAGLLLNNSDQSVLSIALASGFSDVKSFNAAFRKFYDLSPDRYRRHLSSDFPQHAREPFPCLLPPEHPTVAKKLAAYRQNTGSSDKK